MDAGRGAMNVPGRAVGGSAFESNYAPSHGRFLDSDHNNYFRVPCRATYGRFDTFQVLGPYEMYSRMYSS
jgi:hypothetical protein